MTIPTFITEMPTMAKLFWFVLIPISGGSPMKALSIRQPWAWLQGHREPGLASPHAAPAQLSGIRQECADADLRCAKVINTLTTE